MNRPSSWSGAWDWGEYPDENAQMADHQLALDSVKFLQGDLKKPFFLSVGFFRPHVPLFVPPCWFQKYDIESIHLPNIPRWDLDDVPENFLNINSYALAPTHAEVLQDGKQRELTQAYLASISFVDACVGLVVDALQASQYAKNTYVVLWSDHGFHLGEKNHWAKRTLWEESTRVPLLISGPEIFCDVPCKQSVSLVDIYPTLVDLCGLPKNKNLEGLSLVPQLEDPRTLREKPAITSSYFGNHAIRSRDWRLIVYENGEEELYDHRNDPEEFQNLADNPQYETMKNRLRRWLPEQVATEFKKKSERNRRLDKK
jgi:arylsulfatase A-like enzyme